MKQIIITAFAALTGIVAQAQVKETRMAHPISMLQVSDGITVVFKQDNNVQLAAEAADRNTLDNVVTEYKKGTLHIYLKSPDETGMATANGVKVYISGDVTSVTADKGAIIKLEGVLNTANLDIALSSGAVCTGEVNTSGTLHITAKGGAGYRGVITAAHFKGNATGGAYIKASGHADDVNIACQGGSVQAGKLFCKKATVRATNAASVSVNASEYVYADADGSSAIRYYGEPKNAVIGTNSYTIVRETEMLTLN
ncbi:GIN domain-containing protein [Flavobacterium sp. RHBU_24]|uniref:GIN domain-containing protein n=1 Tax=Flavobacterium sp. RHBU_24 TaxID=3391185 RepID=UPI003984CE88